MIYLKLFWNFFLIGCFSFGGGYAMLPLIHQVVTSQGWMTTDQFTDVIGISGMLPGSIGVNAAAFVGYETAGLMGVTVATLGMVLPSLLIILVISRFFQQFRSSHLMTQAFYGLKPVIVGLIVYSAINFSLSMEAITNISWKSVPFILMIFIAFLLLVSRKVHPMFIILLSGVCGVIYQGLLS